MKGADKARIDQLMADLSAISDLPKVPPKTMDHRIEEISDNIKHLEMLREKAVSENATEFDRMRFKLTKDRLARELEQLELEADV